MSREFWSANRRYGLRLDAEALERLLDECGRAGANETGGILVGRYSSQRDCAVVTEVVSPPRDSRHGRTWFVRGVAGLRELLRLRWDAHHYVYLGEWHFHPGSGPDASGTDKETISRLAENAAVRCEVPVLLIAGAPDRGDPVLAAWVASRHGVLTSLRPDEG